MFIIIAEFKIFLIQSINILNFSMANSFRRCTNRTVKGEVTVIKFNMVKSSSVHVIVHG